MQKENDLKEYEAFGYDYYGVLVEGFNDWAAHICESENIKRIFFCARDSYCFYCGFKLKEYTKVESKYFYISKKSLILPLMGTSILDDEILTYSFSNRILTGREWLVQMDLNEAEMRTLMDSVEFTLDDYLDRENEQDRNKALLIIKNIRKCLHEKIEEQLKYFDTYLHQTGFSGHLALVDVGWRGSIQYALQILTKFLGIKVKITGLYLGINTRENMRLNHYYGFAYMDDKKNCRYYQVMSAVALLEMFGMAQHGTVLGYCQDDNEIVQPICNKYEYIGAASILPEDTEIKAVQRGALQYVQDIGNKPKNPWEILDYISQPNRKLIGLFGEWRCCNCELRKLIVTSASNRDRNVISLKNVVKDFGLSYWKSGFLYKITRCSKLSYFFYVILKKYIDN